MFSGLKLQPLNFWQYQKKLQNPIELFIMKSLDHLNANFEIELF